MVVLFTFCFEPIQSRLRQRKLIPVQRLKLAQSHTEMSQQVDPQCLESMCWFSESFQKPPVGWLIGVIQPENPQDDFPEMACAERLSLRVVLGICGLRLPRRLTGRQAEVDAREGGNPGIGIIGLTPLESCDPATDWKFQR